MKPKLIGYFECVWPHDFASQTSVLKQIAKTVFWECFLKKKWRFENVKKKIHITTQQANGVLLKTHSFL